MLGNISSLLMFMLSGPVIVALNYTDHIGGVSGKVSKMLPIFMLQAVQ